MTRVQRRPQRHSPRAAALAVFALAGLLLGITAGCREATDAAPDIIAHYRGRGPLVSPFDRITACSLAFYHGPETALYSNRPYHTRDGVEATRGLAFCRGERHGTNVWIIDVSRPTEIVAFGNAALGLEGRGWQAGDDPVRVEAAGLVFDRVYRRRLAPGRYVVRQGFSPTAPLVFWDDSAVAVVP